MGLRQRAVPDPTPIERRTFDAKSAASSHAKQSRRQDILYRAVLLMNEKGFAGTSIRELAGQCGFSKANFYHHIKDKEEMLFQISYQTLTATVDKVDAILHGDKVSYPQRMCAIVDCFVTLIANHQALLNVYFHERRNLKPAHIRTITRLEREILESIGTFYRGGVATGYFRDLDPAVAVWAILGTCFWMTKWYTAGGPLSHDLISQQFNVLLSEGVSAITSPARSRSCSPSGRPRWR